MSGHCGFPAALRCHISPCTPERRTISRSSSIAESSPDPSSAHVGGVGAAEPSGDLAQRDELSVPA